MRLAVAVALALLPMLAFAQKTGDQIVRVAGEDTEMNAAIAKARGSLDEFLALSRKPPKGARNFKLKVKFSDANGNEHMWVVPFKQHGDDFSGTLANEPEMVRTVQAWQTVRFSRADITDWGYERDGKQFGSFTVCVMLTRMPAEEARAYDAYGFQCQD
ncbi:YegJ family protein [Lysobacter solisilvae (ex Woo and Kim 2020)]|uniref:DUF2314 domain-containing protein n=1 Tax=Agrilutibacter terrestris TaxID=2865112 RepID=A0A7H0G0V1_9GAMM|nr:DUF2314 domain-containing protein [Lysobacter terrestris]QNP41917.1 DUF2314 domain-containing protein [Lysobacter terrestris]